MYVLVHLLNINIRVTVGTRTLHLYKSIGAKWYLAQPFHAKLDLLDAEDDEVAEDDDRDRSDRAGCRHHKRCFQTEGNVDLF